MFHVSDESDEWGNETIPEESSATVLIGIIVGVVVAVILLFSLALIIDCRNKKMLLPVNRSQILKRPRLPIFITNSALNNENIIIANQMCNEETLPPVLGRGNPS
ncbi:hypothetical protein C0J52_01806 [Blattella germanica]|nr:hypothetical protein C0J52_01806 [Blattella germanica]